MPLKLRAHGGSLCRLALIPALEAQGRGRLCPMWPVLLAQRLTGMSSVSSRKRALTDTRASSGHSWNQSMAVQLTTAGNFLARTRRTEPTGEKHRITWGQDTEGRSWGLAAPRPAGATLQRAHVEQKALCVVSAPRVRGACP